MKTLYDILNAHPNDDAERLKVAFRKAAMACHPDLNLHDPEAPVRFIQVVRAKAILSNPELRVAYDRMLEFERELCPTSKLIAWRSIAADAIAAMFLAVMLAGAYTLFTYISDNTVAKTEAAAVAVHRPANVVTAPSGDSQRDRFESAETPVPDAVAPTVIGNVVETLPSIRLAPNRLLHQAKFFHQQGIASYHDGDISLAITDFDLAIRLDPEFEDAYIDRGIALYRMRDFNRAFADIAQAMRIENSRRNIGRKVTP